jgi:hypothetical protein
MVVKAIGLPNPNGRQHCLKMVPGPEETLQQVFDQELRDISVKPVEPFLVTIPSVIRKAFLYSTSHRVPV